MRFTIKFALIAIIPILLGFSCMSWLFKDDNFKPVAIFAAQDYASRCVILAKDLEINSYIQPYGEMPYSSNASAGVWIGTEFPVEIAIEIVSFSRKYYKDMRYFVLSDYKDPGAPRQIHHEMFVGGDTETALKLGLTAWTEKDFARLKSLKTKEEFHELIRSKYPQ